MVSGYIRGQLAYTRSVAIEGASWPIRGQWLYEGPVGLYTVSCHFYILHTLHTLLIPLILLLPAVLPLQIRCAVLSCYGTAGSATTAHTYCLRTL